jgi:hypothetical protein
VQEPLGGTVARPEASRGLCPRADAQPRSRGKVTFSSEQSVFSAPRGGGAYPHRILAPSVKAHISATSLLRTNPLSGQHRVQLVRIDVSAAWTLAQNRYSLA